MNKKPAKKEASEKLKELKTRIPESSDEILVNAVEILKEQGYEPTKSELVRTIIEYRLSNAVYIYRESQRVARS